MRTTDRVLRVLAACTLPLLAAACGRTMVSSIVPAGPATVVLGIAQDGGVPQAGSV